MKTQIADFYLTFLNDWLTVERYAEWLDMSVTDCESLLRMGRQYHGERTE
jgi:hypothetical protein